MPNIQTIQSEQQQTPYIAIQGLTTNSAELLSQFQDTTIRAFKGTALTESFIGVSRATGGYVEFRQGEYFIPVLVGNNGKALPLYEFVEVVDGLVDYEQIKAELPTLSISQISGAMAFVRKMAQLNPFGIDPDEIEDALDAEDQEIIDALRTGLAEQEHGRVLYLDQTNC